MSSQQHTHSFNLNRSIFNLVTLQQLSQKVRFPYKTWSVMVQVFLWPIQLQKENKIS